MKPLSQLKRDFAAKSREMEQLIKDAPRIVGLESVKVIRENFDNQGFEGSPWKDRSAKTNEMYDKRIGVKGSVYKSSNPILMQTRNLYSSIKFKALGNSVFIGVNLNLVPYAKVINEGSGNQPKRQYMGITNKLKTRINKEIQRRRLTILNKYKI